MATKKHDCRWTYGPAFLAKLAVDKCGDATPIYRIEKAMRRAGIPISRSTMNDLVLIAADVCKPLWDAALAEVKADPHLTGRRRRPLREPIPTAVGPERSSVLQSTAFPARMERLAIPDGYVRTHCASPLNLCPE